MLSLLRRSWLLCALVMFGITSLFGLPWKIIGNTVISQQEEDDDNEGDDSERDTLSDPYRQPKLPPRLQPQRQLAEPSRPQSHFIAQLQRPSPPPLHGAPFQAPIRLQI